MLASALLDSRANERPVTGAALLFGTRSFSLQP
jgi:hypothetical protein